MSHELANERVKSIGFVVLAAVALAIQVAPQSPSSPPPAAPAQPAAPNPDAHYQIGPDSLPRDGVPKGEMRGPFTLPSEAYPGTQHTYWVYVPAQYDPKTPIITGISRR